MFARMSRTLLLILLTIGTMPVVRGFTMRTSASTSRNAGYGSSRGRQPRIGGSVASIQARPQPAYTCTGRLGGAASAEDGSAPRTTSNTGKTKRTCRKCKQQYSDEENSEDACRYHPGIYSGRLNRVNDVDTSDLEFFWSCCGESSPEHPGCVHGRHESYDDPPEGGRGGWRSPLTGVWRSD